MSTTFFASFTTVEHDLEPLLENHEIESVHSFVGFKLYLYKGGSLPESSTNCHWSIGIDQYGAIHGPVGPTDLLKLMSDASIYLQLNQDYGIACSATGLASLIRAFEANSFELSRVFDDLEQSSCITSSGICIFRGWLNSLDIGSTDPYDADRAIEVNSVLETIAQDLDPESSEEFLICYNSVKEGFLPVRLGNNSLDQGPFIGPRNQLFIGLDCLSDWNKGNIKIDESGFEENL
jgi:hypothetical protein